MKKTFIMALLCAIVSGLKAQNTFPTPSGNVGIGTNSPGHPLQINQPIDGLGTISVITGSGTVSGTGTNFLADFNIGDTFNANSETHTITAITSATSMTTDNWTSSFTGNYTTSNSPRFIFSGKGALFTGAAPTSLPVAYLAGLQTFTNNSSIYGIYNQVSSNQTNSTFSNTIVGALSSAIIGGANTQNWSGSFGTVGTWAKTGVASGASGTISNVVGIYVNSFNSSSNATVTNLYGMLNLPSGVSGRITNLIGYGNYNLGLATNNTGIYLTATGGTTVPVAAAGNYGVYDATGYKSYFAGKIGIGNTSPNAGIEITNTSEQLRLGYDATHYSSFTTSSAGGLLISTPSSATTINTFATLAATDIGLGIDVYHGVKIARGTGVHNEALLDLFTNDPGTTGANLFRIRNSSNDFFDVGSNGNVGIGAITPAAKLEITNTTEQLRLGYDATHYSSFTAASNGGLSITSPAGTTINTYAPLAGTNIGLNISVYHGVVIGRGSGVHNEALLDLFTNDPGTTGANLFRIRNSSNDFFDVSSSGNVGIGTTDNSSWQLANSTYKLAVGGNIIAEEMVVKLQTNWPDYVFKKEYTLMPLPQLQDYINAHQHLPELPSAGDVEKRGQNLGEMNRLLVKKVEELTLYMIEKDKQIKAQEQRLKDLEDRLARIEKQ
jgi:glutaredoxin-related protein